MFIQRISQSDILMRLPNALSVQKPAYICLVGKFTGWLGVVCERPSKKNSPKFSDVKPAFNTSETVLTKSRVRFSSPVEATANIAVAASK